MLTVKFNTITLWEVKERTDVQIVDASLNTTGHRRHVIALLEHIFAVLDVRESGKTTAKNIQVHLYLQSALFLWIQQTLNIN